MKHNICGREFWFRASHFTSSGSRCKVCSLKNMNAKTHEQFINVKNITPYVYYFFLSLMASSPT